MVNKYYFNYQGKEWSAGATHRFYHLTKNYRNLVGLVCGVKVRASIMTELFIIVINIDYYMLRA